MVVTGFGYNNYSISNANPKLFFVVIYGMKKDIIPRETKSVIQGLLKGMGVAHLTTTSFLIVKTCVGEI